MAERKDETLHVNVDMLERPFDLCYKTLEP
jgi:hypothetical protein